MNVLKCDMLTDCTAEVTHIDEKGWVYCTEHGLIRRDYMRCRKLRPWELHILTGGNPLRKY